MLITFTGLSLLFATAAGFAGDFYWRLDLFSHFRPQVATLLIVTMLFAAAMRHWRWLLLWAVAFTANLLSIAPLYIAPAGRDNVPPNTQRLRVLHLNAYFRHKDNTRLARWIDAQQADLIFIQEFTPDLHEALTQTLSHYRLHLSVPLRNTRGLAMLVPVEARFELDQARVFDLVNSIDRPYIETFLRLGEREIAVLSAHVARPTAMREQRDQQIELAACAAWARRQVEVGRATVIIGDFNATPFSVLFRQIEADSGLLNSQRGYGLSATWHAKLPFWSRIAIDHCIHSPDLATVDRRVGPDVGSDHLPLYVEVAVK